MATRAVTGQIKRPDNSAWANAVVRIRLTDDAYTTSPAETYPSDTLTIVADDNGQFSVALVSGLDAPYEVTWPDGEKRRFLLAAGSSVAIETLIAAYEGPPVTVETIETVLAALSSVTFNGQLLIQAGNFPLDLYRYLAGASSLGTGIRASRSRHATIGSHAIVLDGDVLLGILARGSDGADWRDAGGLNVVVDGPPGSNNMPSKILLRTGPGGGGAVADRVIIDKNGNLLSLGGAIGYTTGAGGTVTQQTNKSTGVTINEPSGQITMNNAALAPSAVVTFTVTNSHIATTDVVLLSIDSGATAGAYLVQVSAVGAGTCNITLRNLTAGSLSEAIVLNFVVIKAATT
jgi:hypothetical protein